MHHPDSTDWHADWATEIDDARLALDGALVDAINALTRAQRALSTLTSEHVYDIEFVEDPRGADTASFIADSLRNSRAAYHIVHPLI
jgi:hypothetical protein